MPKRIETPELLELPNVIARLKVLAKYLNAEQKDTLKYETHVRDRDEAEACINLSDGEVVLSSWNVSHHNGDHESCREEQLQPEQALNFLTNVLRFYEDLALKEAARRVFKKRRQEEELALEKLVKDSLEKELLAL